MSGADPLPVPEPVLAGLRERIRRMWTATGRDPEPVLAALPIALPAGVVRRLAGGGPFGWTVAARLDVVDGRLALECLDDDRMSGPDHYRLWEDGSREDLPNEHTTMVFPKGATPEDEARIREEFFAHNRRVQALLRERGF